ncbi:MAG: hypothetical protein COA45_00790 [Zetaproteobacteria bacterium]|nr:MAG: hypothetical protein COA45_00790 [Zetaproteobacteria bacterium]
MVYSSNGTEDLKQDVQKLLSEQRENIVGTYPADFLYHPMVGEDGNPLVVKVDDTYYAAWMSRDAAGEPFSKVSLLTENQVNEIYAQIPAGPSGKMNTGASVYVNPDFKAADPKHEIAADSVSRVTFNVETGDVVNAAQAAAEMGRAERIARRAARSGTEVDASSTSKYDTALLPISVTKDGNVSPEDLKQQLNGYQLISHVDSVATEEVNKRAATGIIINGVGVSIPRLLVTQGGAIAPSMEIENAAALSAAANIGLETRLVSPLDAAPAAPATAPAAPVDSGFENKMQGMINSGPGTADPNSAFKALEVTLLSGGFDDIAKNLAKGTLAGDSAAMANVDSLVVLFPEHRDIIASYALAEEKNASTDPKTYLDQVQQRNPSAAPQKSGSTITAPSSGSAASEKLQGLLNTVGGHVENGERVSQINRDVDQVRRHLDSISGDKALFQSDAKSTVDYLNAQGLTEHAKIMSGYAYDPSTSRAVRGALREVAVMGTPTLTAAQVADNKAWEKTATEGSPDKSVSVSQFTSEINEALKNEKVLEALKNAGIDPSVLAVGGIQGQFEKAQATVNGGQSSPLDVLLNKIGQDVDNKASSSQINRDVGQVLRYLNNFAPNKELLQLESTRAIDFLNDKGLTKHADIISDFAKDPSTFKDARSAIREIAQVNVNSSAFDQLASNVEGVSGQIDEFKEDLENSDSLLVADLGTSPNVSLAGAKV